MPRDEGMTRLWTQVYAMLPTEWEFRGIVAGPREADPHVRKGQWLVWARHSGSNERADGVAESPEGAMRDLANKLRAIRADSNG